MGLGSSKVVVVLQVSRKPRIVGRVAANVPYIRSMPVLLGPSIRSLPTTVVGDCALKPFPKQTVNKQNCTYCWVQVFPHLTRAHRW